MTSSADVIVLSSSPSPPQRTPVKSTHETELVIGVPPPAASPPSLPSPSELFQLPSRSRFVPSPSVHKDVVKKKKSRTDTETASSGTSEKDASAKPRQKAKKAAKQQKPGALCELQPDSLDSKKNVAKKPAGSQKGRPRSSAKSKEKEKEQGNMTLAGKVTKTSNESSTKSSSKSGKKKSATRDSAAEAPEESRTGKQNTLEKDEELHLDVAMRRRLDWTPPRETAPSDNHAVGDDDGLTEEHDKRPESGLGKVLSHYSYSGSASETRDIAAKAPGGGPTKRRRIELVDPQVYPPATKRSGGNHEPPQEEDSLSVGVPGKRKAKTQKRFTTLTARMTAQYTNDSEDSDLVDTVVPDVSKAKSQRGKAKSMNKEPEFIVLSPEAAAKSLNDQDLIFGTCSQLERDDSPETLREMQKAIRESESLVSEEKERSPKPGAAQVGPRQSSSIRSVSRLAGARNLWSVGTRDTHGSLVQAEKQNSVDLTGVIQGSQSKEKCIVEAQTGPLEDDWFEPDYGKPSLPSRKATTLSEKLSKPAVETKAPVSAETTAPVKPSQPEPTNHQGKDSQQPSMPQYEGFTDAELTKQVAAYGFKSVRGRKKMIELLQKCWESKHGTTSKESQRQAQRSSQPEATPMASNEALSDSIPSQAAKPKPKQTAKSKQRTSQSAPSGATPQPELATTLKKISRKASNSERLPESSFIDVDEIQDSEEETFLSPSQVQRRYTEMFSKAHRPAREPSLDFLPRATSPSPAKRKKPAPKTSKPQPPIPSTQANMAGPSKRSSLPDLSTQITKAVRAQPELSPLSSALGSRSRPTWHEKILMYDPIILEDLTTWLNVEGLGLVGEDREVGAATVREWCESKGICCCWKKNASW